jgi:hypothetical protein
LDFQGALRKIIPGLVLSISPHPDIFNQSDSSNYFQGVPPSSFHPDESHDKDQDLMSVEPESYDYVDKKGSKDKEEVINSTVEPLEVPEEGIQLTDITEDQILQDLNGNVSTPSEQNEIPELDILKEESTKSSFLTVKAIEENDNILLTTSEDSSTSQDTNPDSDESDVEKVPNNENIKINYSALNESNIDQRESIPPDPVYHNGIEKIIEATAKATDRMEELIEKAENKKLFVTKGDIEQES